MYKLDLTKDNAQAELKGLLSHWNDHSKVVRPLVIVKVSEAFTMYHETGNRDWSVENQAFQNLHPVLINNLDTNFSVILSLDTAGRMVHSYLIDDTGSLRQRDGLLKFAHKNRHQEYLDPFYCINRNLQRHLDGPAD